jgi:hypothetical protein
LMFFAIEKLLYMIFSPQNLSGARPGEMPAHAVRSSYSSRSPAEREDGRHHEFCGSSAPSC